jgi:ABC-type sugar transport system substrate-binding protein
MSNHKSLPLVGLTAALSVALGACAGTSSGKDSGSVSSKSGEKSVQFVNPLPNYPAWRTIGDCMKDEAKTRGVELTETGPTGQAIDANAMIEQIQQAIADKKGGIITLPASQAFGPLLKQAQGKGIVTATMYGDGAPSSGADANVGSNWPELGAAYVQAIAARPGEQRVGLIAVSNTGVGKSWMDGFRAAAAKTKNVKVVGEVYTGDDSAKALAQTNALLTAHPELNVIATHMGTVTQGAVSALKARGLTGKVAFVGNGPDNGGKEALAGGAEYRMLVQGLCAAGKDALDAVADRLDGKVARDPEHPQQIDVGTKMADKSNLDALLQNGWG